MLKKKQNKVKKYLDLARKNPDYAFFDMLNLVSIIFILSILLLFLVWIGNVFSGKMIADPIAFSIGGWNIYWYGVIFAIAFLLGIFVVLRESKRLKYNYDLIINFIFGTALSGFVGARILFVLLNLDYFSKDPVQVINIWQGGLSFYGALLGGMLFIIIYAKIKKINYWQILDLFAPAFLLGQVIGRWGNFFNQELFGYPTSSFLKMYISPLNRPALYRSSAYFHPVFLYESLLCLIALIILLAVRRKKWIRSGEIFLGYLILYSVIRFFIEFIRIEPKVALGLTLAQIASVGIAVLVLLAVVLRRKTKIKEKKTKKKLITKRSK